MRAFVIFGAVIAMPRREPAAPRQDETRRQRGLTKVHLEQVRVRDRDAS